MKCHHFLLSDEMVNLLTIRYASTLWFQVKIYFSLKGVQKHPALSPFYLGWLILNLVDRLCVGIHVYFQVSIYHNLAIFKKIHFLY